MKVAKPIIVFLIVCFLGTGQNIMAQAVSAPRAGGVSAWRTIGTTTVNGGVDHDAIKVVGAGDNFKKIKIKVTNSGLNMTRMVVTYDGGGIQKIDIRSNIQKGGESRIIDLNGGKRSIRKIEFWYKDTGFLNGRAKVTVLGRK